MNKAEKSYQQLKVIRSHKMTLKRQNKPFDLTDEVLLNIQKELKNKNMEVEQSAITRVWGWIAPI